MKKTYRFEMNEAATKQKGHILNTIVYRISRFDCAYTEGNVLVIKVDEETPEAVVEAQIENFFKILGLEAPILK